MNRRKTVMEQLRLQKKAERRLRQNMGRPMVVPNKKKQDRKYACRG